MKIRRFVAKDSRTAMRQVREELGPDAVIMANRRMATGVEVLAAIDYDESLLQQQAKSQTPTASVNKTTDRAQKLSQVTQEAFAADLAARIEAEQEQYHQPQRPSATESIEPPPTIPSVREAEPEPSPDPALGEMRLELQNLRGLLEHQLSGLAWHDLKARKPLEAELLRRFLMLGLEANFSRHMAAQVVNIMPDSCSFAAIWAEAMDKLAALIPVCNHDLITKTPAVVAFVGPVGVGKSTTLAKLATRHVIAEGSSGLGLITLDSQRIGAQEQLRAYARILGVHLRVVQDESELQQAIDAFYDKKLILIDTPGMRSWADKAGQALLSLKKGLAVKMLLTLSATSQYSVMAKTLSSFKHKQLQGCILTKIDEAVSLGEAISVAIQHDCPLMYYTDGQKVPEDIEVAMAQQLVSRAVQLGHGEAGVERDETLALRISGLVADAN